MTKLNSRGGVESQSTEDLRRAKKGDLITLPTDIVGTNCFNCKYIRDKHWKVGYCSHPKMSQEVSKRMCCSYWDAKGIYREFGKIDEKYI